MTRFETQANCWQAFLACMTDSNVEDVATCSTENDDWEEQSQVFLARRGFFFVEMPLGPEKITALPGGLLVGAGVHSTDTRRPHVLIARTHLISKRGPVRFNGFSVYHDPSGQWPKEIPIVPKSIILLCKRDPSCHQS